MGDEEHGLFGIISEDEIGYRFTAARFRMHGVHPNSN